MIDDIARGKHAEQLLADPLLQEALATLDAQLIEAWGATGADDADKREQLWALLKAGRRFEAYLRALVDNAAIVAARAAAGKAR